MEARTDRRRGSRLKDDPMAVQINFVWIGPRLGPVHAACIRSFRRHGHPVVLHAFDRPEDAPEDIDFFDASKLMRRDEIITYRKTRSLSLASNIYRYRMLREGMGYYFDCDVYCLRPIPDDEYLFGWESDSAVSNAVLGAPHDSELVRRLNGAVDDRFFVPPWRSKGRQRWMRFRNAIGMPLSPADMPWGTLGPSLLTHTIKELGLTGRARPIDVFYPLHFAQTPLLYDPGVDLESLTTPRSYAVHLANAMLKSGQAPKGSPLHQIIDTDGSNI